MENKAFSQDEIIDGDEVLKMARHIATTLGSRMCDENGDTHGEELYCMAFDDIVDSIKLVAVAAASKEREACLKICEAQAQTNYWEGADVCAEAIRARAQAERGGS